MLLRTLSRLLKNNSSTFELPLFSTFLAEEERKRNQLENKIKTVSQAHKHHPPSAFNSVLCSILLAPNKLFVPYPKTIMSNCPTEGNLEGQPDDMTSHQEESQDTSIEVKTAGLMMSQHAELMCTHAEQLQSMLGNPDEASRPWGCHDHDSYEMIQYGNALVKERDKNDSIHEINVLRRQITQITKELRNTRKRAMVSKDIIVRDITQDELKMSTKIKKVKL